MTRKISAFVLMGLLCAALAMPQEWNPTDGQWTDKNNTEQYARYLILGAYGEHGYLDARVEVMQQGAKRLFVVDPGAVFHVKEVEVRGLENFPQDAILKEAPQSGDVYSAERVNQWIEGLRKQYGGERGPLTILKHGAQYDRVNAAVTVRLDVREVQ